MSGMRCQIPVDHTGGETHTGLTVLSHRNALSDALKAGWSIKMEFIQIKISEPESSPACICTSQSR